MRLLTRVVELCLTFGHKVLQTWESTPIDFFSSAAIAQRDWAMVVAVSCHWSLSGDEVIPAYLGGAIGQHQLGWDGRVESSMLHEVQV